jgi:hypothetical protein
MHGVTTLTSNPVKIFTRCPLSRQQLRRAQRSARQRAVWPCTWTTDRETVDSHLWRSASCRHPCCRSDPPASKSAACCLQHQMSQLRSVWRGARWILRIAACRHNACIAITPSFFAICLGRAAPLYLFDGGSRCIMIRNGADWLRAAFRPLCHRAPGGGTRASIGRPCCTPSGESRPGCCQP